MKFAILLTLSYLLFAFITISDGSLFVRDNNGQLMFPGSRFYILAGDGKRWPHGGGGVSVGNTGDLKCPVTVLQNYNDTDHGIPVKFNILAISIGYITTGAPLGIDFKQQPLVPKCAKSSKWLVYVDNITKKAFVGIGGPENYPNKQIINGTFGIRDYENYRYKLVFCVNRHTCLDIGRLDNHEGGRRLTVNLTNNEPFQVVFKRAPFNTSVIT